MDLKISTQPKNLWEKSEIATGNPCNKKLTRLNFFLISSMGVFGSICKTSNGFKLAYEDPGRKSLSICCFGVRTESLCSVSFNCKKKKSQNRYYIL